jgi:hypothetical protein
MTGSGALEPYAPLNVLKAFASEVWIVDGPEIGFRYLGLTLPFPTRMTLVRLPDGSLWVHSPIAPSEELFSRVLRLGPVRILIAPNTLHHWWILDWKARFPEATVYAVPGLRKSGHRTLPIDHVLGGAAPPAWSEVIAQVIVPGDLLTEAAFCHLPSRTLIVTDLIENFEPQRVRNRFYRLVLRYSGAADPDGKAPIDMRFSFLRHRAAVRRAARQMLAWQPERIIVAHGRCYETRGIAELRRAFRWIL